MAKSAKERQQARRDRLKSGLIPVTVFVKQREADLLAEAGILPGWSADARSVEDRKAIGVAVQMVFRRGLADVTRDEPALADLLQQGDKDKNQDLR